MCIPIDLSVVPLVPSWYWIIKYYIEILIHFKCIASEEQDELSLIFLLYMEQNCDIHGKMHTFLWLLLLWLLRIAEKIEKMCTPWVHVVRAQF